MNQKKIPKHTGVPTFFKIACSEANRVGTKTYFEAAWHLAIHIDSAQVPDDADPNEWEDVYLKRLTDACARSDESRIWEWFRRHYPECMKLVPKQRKEEF